LSGLVGSGIRVSLGQGVVILGHPVEQGVGERVFAASISTARAARITSG
jgi:hypothetical protein